MAPRQARRVALGRLGGGEVVNDKWRDGRCFAAADDLRRDVLYAVRGLRRSPVFTWIAIASLALGIGANTALFSFVNAILLQRLPVSEPHRLVTFAETYPGESAAAVWNLGTVRALAEQDAAFDGVFGWFSRPVSLSMGDSGRWVNGELVTGQYYRTLRVSPAVGRLLNEDDVRNAGADPVCVLSYGLWQRDFGGDPGVIGQSVLLNGRGYRVIGVTARGFHGAELHRRFDVGLPATRIGDFLPAFGGPEDGERMNTMSWLVAMGRLGTGIARTEAERYAELALQETNPKRQAQLRLEDGGQGFNTIRPAFGRPVLVLMGIVTLVLLVACANLGSSLLARAQARYRELAVRSALGASRARLVRQLLVETFVIAGVGGLGGIVLSFWMRDSLVAVLNAGRLATAAVHVTVDVSVLAFAILLTCAVGILCGMVPARMGSRQDLVSGLKRESATRGSGERMPWPQALVVMQVAVSVAVVFCAGLLTQTLRTLSTVDLGFEPDRVVALRVDPAASGYSGAGLSRIFDEMLARTRALPGVAAASLASSTPHGALSVTMGIEVPGYVPGPVRGDAVASFNFVSSGYFETLGQSLIRGRDFDAGDERGRPLVAIVNETLVEHYFDGRNPVGRQFRQGGEEVEIVGVVTDAREQAIRSAPADTVYIHEKQGPTSGMTLLVRAEGGPERIVPPMLAMVRSIDRRMPVASVHTLDVDVGAGISSERLLGYLSTLFAALTLVLAGIGLYGVLAASIVRRTREIGLRSALGARRRDLVVLFGRESATLVVVGVTVGGVLALASAPALSSVLFGVGATDPVTLIGSIGVLAVVALLATAIPLWRAARVDPMVALRQE